MHVHSDKTLPYCRTNNHFVCFYANKMVSLAHSYYRAISSQPQWVSTFGGMEWWNGIVEWTTGMVECFIEYT